MPDMKAVTEYEKAAEQFSNARGQSQRDAARARWHAAKHEMDRQAAIEDAIRVEQAATRATLRAALDGLVDAAQEMYQSWVDEEGGVVTNRMDVAANALRAALATAKEAGG
jgi:hypothetical protein